MLRYLENNVLKKMYKLRYYMSGQTLVSKYFNTLHDAIMYSIQRVVSGNMYSIDKVEK